MHEKEDLRNLMNKQNRWVRWKREVKGVSTAPQAEKRNQNRDQRSGHGRIGADGAQFGGEADSIFRSPGSYGTSWGFGGGYSSRPGSGDGGLTTPTFRSERQASVQAGSTL